MIKKYYLTTEKEFDDYCSTIDDTKYLSSVVKTLFDSFYSNNDGWEYFQSRQTLDIHLWSMQINEDTELLEGDPYYEGSWNCELEMSPSFYVVKND